MFDKKLYQYITKGNCQIIGKKGSSGEKEKNI